MLNSHTTINNQRYCLKCATAKVLFFELIHILNVCVDMDNNFLKNAKDGRGLAFL